MMIENCHNGGPAGNTPHYDEKGELQVRSYIICNIRSKMSLNSLVTNTIKMDLRSR